MEQKMHKRILSFIEEERLLSGDERICVDIFRRLKKNRSYLPSLHAVVELAKSFNCSADFLLGLSDFPDSADENNRRKFILQKSEQICQTAPDKILFA